MVFGVSAGEPGLETEPGLTCVTERGEGPSASESLKRIPGAKEEMEMSSKAKSRSAAACGGVLVMVVSTAMARELSGSESSMLKLPKASLNFELVTEINPGSMESGLGVKMAE